MRKLDILEETRTTRATERSAVAIRDMPKVSSSISTLRWSRTPSCASSSIEPTTLLRYAGVSFVVTLSDRRSVLGELAVLVTNLLASIERRGDGNCNVGCRNIADSDSLRSQVNQQGHDRGTQYRSAIFTTTPSQAEVARKVTEEVQKAHYDARGKKIATVITEATKWWDAEDYHQEWVLFRVADSVCSPEFLANRYDDHRYLTKNPGGYECANHRLWW